MKKSSTETLKAQNTTKRLEDVPWRIFLDTNVLQYIQDFGEFVFDHCREHEAYFLDSKGNKITKDNRLYYEILALEQIFLGIDRTNMEFALSETVLKEVIDKKDSAFYRWSYEVWDNWQTVVAEYEDNPFSRKAKKRYKQACHDKSLLGNLSKRDREIVLDSIRFDCDALLTVDRFADKNKQKFVYNKYTLKILTPTDLIEVLRPFQALWF